MTGGLAEFDPATTLNHGPEECAGQRALAELPEYETEGDRP